jgi:hypothetical protein
MKYEWRDRAAKRDRTSDPVYSRRSALSFSGWVLLGAVAGPALGQTEGRGVGGKGPAAQPAKEGRRMEPPQALIERMRNAGGHAGPPQGISEQFARQRQMAFENLRNQLQISDQEWPVVKPRLQVVYDLVRPVPSFGRQSAQPATPVEQRSGELREVLGNKDAEAEEIKARLTALRAAKEQARQELVKARDSLRQIMTLRQEALLVLNGLLD